MTERCVKIVEAGGKFQFLDEADLYVRLGSRSFWKSSQNVRYVEAMAADKVPPRPPNSTRIVIELSRAESRLDTLLLAALRAQDENPELKAISRVAFKELFNNGKVTIKGQRARPSSGLAAGTTYVDILG